MDEGCENKYSDSKSPCNLYSAGFVSRSPGYCYGKASHRVGCKALILTRNYSCELTGWSEMPGRPCFPRGVGSCGISCQRGRRAGQNAHRESFLLAFSPRKRENLSGESVPCCRPGCLLSPCCAFANENGAQGEASLRLRPSSSEPRGLTSAVTRSASFALPPAEDPNSSHSLRKGGGALLS